TVRSSGSGGRREGRTMAARITSAVALLGLLAALAVPTAAQEAGGPVVERWAGNDRYATAAAVADGAFDDAVDRVFLATGVDFADALAAGPATRGTAPILLTSPESLPPATASGLQRLSPREVVILGGDAAVSDDVAEA